MILQNGFGQTLAFWKAKGKNEHNIMFDIVQEWFLKKKFAKGSTAHESGRRGCRPLRPDRQLLSGIPIVNAIIAFWT